MSTNLSKKKRDEMLAKITELKEANATNIETISILNSIESELKRKKYGLIWEEHSEAVDEEMETKIPVFTEDISKRIIKDESAKCNFLLEGDNLHSLYLLNKTCKGAVDIIYIDPPYNTGNNDFIYDDDYVNSDDGFIDSKWLSFMHRRLVLAKTLLKQDGVIFISIDDHEISQLKLLCDEIFGSANFICNAIRRNKAGAGHDSRFLSVEYDYILMYARDINKLSFNRQKVDTDGDTKYKFSDEYVDRRGKYYLRDLAYKGANAKRSNWTITCPDGTVVASDDFGRQGHEWRWGQEKVKWGIENGFIVFKKVKEKWNIYIKQYQYVDNEDKIRDRFIPYRAMITDYLNTEGTSELNSMLGANEFSYPKPVSLIKFLIGLIDKKDALILDFFAGSGTTGHATLAINAEDGGNRHFILCTNNQNSICENVTYKRLKMAIEGYDKRANKGHVEGLGGNLLYYKNVFVEKSNRDYFEYSEDLLKYVKELIQIERLNVIDRTESIMIMNDDMADELITNDIQCKYIYKSNDVLLTLEQKKIIYAKDIDLIEIPNYYFKEVHE